jgi:hypothetical protein
MKHTMHPEDINTSSTSGKVLRAVSWASVGFSAVALGLIIGRELRQRYKFSKRTPYDFYSHAGEEIPSAAEYGIGI